MKRKRLPKKHTRLADRPAANLRAFMLAMGEDLGKVDAHGRPEPISGRYLASLAWPDVNISTSRGRIEHALARGQTRPDNMEAIASVFGVDAGVFYQEPGQ